MAGSLLKAPEGEQRCLGLLKVHDPAHLLGRGLGAVLLQVLVPGGHAPVVRSKIEHHYMPAQ